MNEGGFEVTQKWVMPPPKESFRYPISINDWERLKRLIKKVVPHTRTFQIGYSVAFSFSVSAIFAAIGFLSAKEVPLMAWGIVVLIFLASIVCGIALVIIDNKQKEVLQIPIDAILEEMSFIEKDYAHIDE